MKSLRLSDAAASMLEEEIFQYSQLPPAQQMTKTRAQIIIKISLMLGIPVDKKCHKHKSAVKKLEAVMCARIGEIMDKDWKEGRGHDEIIMDQIEDLVGESDGSKHPYR